MDGEIKPNGFGLHSFVYRSKCAVRSVGRGFSARRGKSWRAVFFNLLIAQ